MKDNWFKKTIKRDDGEPYLIRYRIFGCKFFKIRIHHILKSDYDCLHDRPWNFISIILKGGYIEHTERTYSYLGGYAQYTIPYRHRYWPLSILYRPANWKHKLEVIPGVDCWTFVIMFKRKRDWGFWTKRGFVNWKDYNGNEACE